MFKDASVYNKCNYVPIREAREALRKYHKLIKYNGNDVILDVGSGCGYVTLDVLLPKISQDNFRLVGVDKLQSMVDFAKDKVKDPRVTFRVANINDTTEKVKSVFTDEELNPGFSHVFSFNCLQYNPPDLTQCYKNMFELLRPGGQLFTLKAGYCVMNYIWEEVHKLEKWQQYIQNEPVYAFPFHKSEQQITECTNMLKKIGFEISICCFERKPMFPVGEPYPPMRCVMELLDPYIHVIPQHLHSQYMDDVMEVHDRIIKENPDFLFDCIICVATKPLN